MATYWEKLKDPRWQRKRLEVLAEHDFHCEVCGDDETTLHVHHKQYFKGRDPWEYASAQLSVVCESCHANQHGSEDVLSVVTSFLPLDGPCSRSSIAALIAGYDGQDAPADKTAMREYLFGILARNLSATYQTSLVDVAALADLSEVDGQGMLQCLLDYAKSNKGAR